MNCHLLNKCIKDDVYISNLISDLCPVKKGDRVAQLVCEKICYPDLQEQMVNLVTADA